MSEHFELTKALIKPKPTTVWGLSFFPDLEPDLDNDRDMPYPGWLGCPEVTDCNLETMRMLVSELGDRCQAIMEIGVNRNGDRSMSQVLMGGKPASCIYVGVDLNDKSHLDDASRNIHTLMSNSHDQAAVRSFLAAKGVAQLDLLFIDGWHSVNTTINDWMYADMLSPHGIVAIHDSNTHPGDIALHEAVDAALFDKRRYCLGHDSGIAVFRRRTEV